MDAATLSKGEFARLINVSPARVSQMIGEGKIGADALQGDGRAARIRVELARRQIAARTDPGQAVGNGIETRVEEAGELALDKPERMFGVGDLYKQEKLEQLRMANARARRQDLEEAGVYVRADQAQAAASKAVRTVVMVFEGALANTAEALAARFGLPARDLQHELTRQFREARDRAAEALRNAAAGTPALIVDGDDETATTGRQEAA